MTQISEQRKSEIEAELERLGVQPTPEAVAAVASLMSSRQAQGKTQDKLGYEKADRLLTQQEYTSNLQLKAINVASLFEEVRHQKVMTGVAANTPSIRSMNV